jgi:hypothetical protein
LYAVRIWNRDTGENVRASGAAEPKPTNYTDRFRKVASHVEEVPNPFLGWGS